MDPILLIRSGRLDPADTQSRMIDMASRCAFAICTEGRFTIKIFNEIYTVSERCLFACMPFVKIEVVSVETPSEVVFGQISIEDLPGMINRWVSIDTLTQIQNCPLVKIPDSEYERLITQIDQLREECGENKGGEPGNVCDLISRDIIDYRIRLIVAYVLKIYFGNIRIEVKDHTQRDIVFQHFMLDLYRNFKEQRNVQFYASRASVSQKYFSTLVRQLSGVSPSGWIETVVVTEAKSMLADPRLSIKDIAAALNFPDAPTFTKYFLRVAGLTPKAYRKSTV